MTDSESVAKQCAEAESRLRHWFLNQALPMWSSKGIDDIQGGFFERLSERGEPLDEPRRTRVVARQIYVFCVAQRMGWSGPAERIVRHGLAFLLGRLRQPDGLFASSVKPDGTLVDDRFDLYEQAFALFAMAHASARYPGLQSELEPCAQQTMQALTARFKHPVKGFHEAYPPTLPLRSNPHMHMLEAALAWERITTDCSPWHRLSDELAQLAMQHLIDPATGALYELFDDQWLPLPEQGRLAVEPGHQFEWAWLLLLWGQSRQHAQALQAASRLFLIGLKHGICAQRGVAINQLDAHFAPTDQSAKLWPQTEWIKASQEMALQMPDADFMLLAQKSSLSAMQALMGYLQHPCSGLWHEVQTDDGSFTGEPCRASSLYHIVCAIDASHTDII